MTHALFRHINTNNVINIDYKINVIACHIDLQKRSRPFLRFLLEKEERVLSFPFIRGPISDLRQQCIDLFPEFMEVIYVGYVIFNKEVYVFVSILDVLTSSRLCLSNKRWWCLVDEILNYRRLLNRYAVDRRCVDFLFSNVDFYTLRNEKGIGLEIPYVAFLTSNNIKHTEIDHYFGVSKQDYNYYVFDSCDNVKEGGVIRYAIFGTTPMTENGKTRWFVRMIDDVTSLSWHLLESM